MATGKSIDKLLDIVDLSGVQITRENLADAYVALLARGKVSDAMSLERETGIKADARAHPQAATAAGLAYFQDAKQIIPSGQGNFLVDLLVRDFAFISRATGVRPSGEVDDLVYGAILNYTPFLEVMAAVKAYMTVGSKPSENLIERLYEKMITPEEKPSTRRVSALARLFGQFDAEVIETYVRGRMSEEEYYSALEDVAGSRLTLMDGSVVDKALRELEFFVGKAVPPRASRAVPNALVYPLVWYDGRPHQKITYERIRTIYSGLVDSGYSPDLQAFNQALSDGLDHIAAEIDRIRPYSKNSRSTAIRLSHLCQMASVVGLEMKSPLSERIAELEGLKVSQMAHNIAKIRPLLNLPYFASG